MNFITITFVEEYSEEDAEKHGMRARLVDAYNSESISFDSFEDVCEINLAKLPNGINKIRIYSTARDRRCLDDY
jgi:hypothetical protein